VLIADFKADNKFDSALWESFSYCLDIAHQSKSFRPILTISGSREKYVLFVCFVSGVDKILDVIEIIEAGVQNFDQMRYFFQHLNIVCKKLLTMTIP